MTAVHFYTCEFLTTTSLPATLRSAVPQCPIILSGVVHIVGNAITCEDAHAHVTYSTLDGFTINQQ